MSDKEIMYKCYKCDNIMTPFGSQKYGMQLKCSDCGLYATDETIDEKIQMGLIEVYNYRIKM